MVDIRPTWQEVCHAIGHESEVEGVLDDCPGFVEYQAGEMAEQEYFSLLRAYLGLPTEIEPATAHASILKADIPGMPEAMRVVRGRRYRLGCLSNTNDLHWQEMLSGRFEFPRLLDYQIASHICGASKPEERIYRLFEEECGADPSEIVFLDDTLPNVEAAIDLGWHAIHVERPEDAPRILLEEFPPKG